MKVLALAILALSLAPLTQAQQLPQIQLPQFTPQPIGTYQYQPVMVSPFVPPLQWYQQRTQQWQQQWNNQATQQQAQIAQQRAAQQARQRMCWNCNGVSAANRWKLQNGYAVRTRRTPTGDVVVYPRNY